MPKTAFTAQCSTRSCQSAEKADVHGEKSGEAWGQKPRPALGSLYVSDVTPDITELERRWHAGRTTLISRYVFSQRRDLSMGQTFVTARGLRS